MLGGMVFTEAAAWLCASSTERAQNVSVER